MYNHKRFNYKALKFLKTMALSLLFLIPTMLLVQEMKEWYTLKNGVIIFATVIEPPANCNVKGASCKFEYREEFFFKTKTASCDTLKVGDLVEFRHSSVTNEFVYPHSEGVHKMELFAAVFLVVGGIYSFIKLKPVFLQ